MEKNRLRTTRTDIQKETQLQITTTSYTRRGRAFLWTFARNNATPRDDDDVDITRKSLQFRVCWLLLLAAPAAVALMLVHVAHDTDITNELCRPMCVIVKGF